MAQVEVVFKIKNMTDEKTKNKAIEAAADILGLDYIGANLQEQKLTVRGTMDVDELAKWLTKKVGKVEIIS